MIYFIKAVNSGAIKIGVSNDPRRRLDTMQTGSAEPLELLGVLPGQFEEERRLHEMLKRHRIHGEWFRGDAELGAAVERLLRPSIKELIDRTGARFWFIRGKAVRLPDLVSQEPSATALLCVAIDVCLSTPPDYNEMLRVLWPRAFYTQIEIIVDATHREECWPQDHELLRQPLENTLFDIWVADADSSDRFVPLPLSSTYSSRLNAQEPPHH